MFVVFDRNVNVPFFHERYSSFPDCTSFSGHTSLCWTSSSPSTCHLSVTLKWWTQCQENDFMSPHGAQLSRHLRFTFRNVFPLSPSVKTAPKRNHSVSDSSGDCTRGEVQQSFQVTIYWIVAHEGQQNSRTHGTVYPMFAFLLFSEKCVHRLIVLSDLTPVSLCQVNTHRAVVVGGKSFHRFCLSDKQLLLFSQTASTQSKSVWGQCEEAVNNLLHKQERCKK